MHAAGPPPAQTPPLKIQSNHQLRKHCVAPIKVKLQGFFRNKQWQKAAKAKAKQKWQVRSKARYGAVYSLWQNADNKTSSCVRIGIASDLEGNVGAAVLCRLTASPCAVTK